MIAGLTNRYFRIFVFSLCVFGYVPSASAGGLFQECWSLYYLARGTPDSIFSEDDNYMAFTLKAGNYRVGGKPLHFPEVTFQTPKLRWDDERRYFVGEHEIKSGADPHGEFNERRDRRQFLEAHFGTKLKRIASGGFRDVFEHPTDPNKVIKFYRYSKLGHRLIQRELALQSWAAEMGLPVVKVDTNPDLIKYGIMVQDKIDVKMEGDRPLVPTEASHPEMVGYNKIIKRHKDQLIAIMSQRDVAIALIGDNGLRDAVGLDPGGHGGQNFVVDQNNQVHLIDW